VHPHSDRLELTNVPIPLSSSRSPSLNRERTMLERTERVSFLIQNR
jgi:hypothetical protein